MARSREIIVLVAAIITSLATGVAAAQTAAERLRHAREVLERQRAEEDRKLGAMTPAQRRAEEEHVRQIHAEEARKHDEEARKHAEEERQRVERHLRTAYLWYSYAQLCNQARKDYLATEVNDIELQRARTAANAIEKAAIAKDPTINPDKIFAEADKVARANFRESLAEGKCRRALHTLLAMSPVNSYQTQRP